MTPTSTMFRGIVRGGVVIPNSPAVLPEGAEVTILMSKTEIPDELRDEFEAWERASDEAWMLIEAEEQRGKQ